jgi:hypothetical protein
MLKDRNDPVTVYCQDVVVEWGITGMVMMTFLTPYE